MATGQVNGIAVERAQPRPEQITPAEREANAETVPRVLWLLVLVVPLLVSCTVLVPVHGGAACACGAAAGAVVIAWPWWQLYRTMREHEREHPAERRRPWWQRWPWGSPPVPQPKTRLDRLFETLGVVSAAGLGLLLLAWVCGVL